MANFHSSSVATITFVLLILFIFSAAAICTAAPVCLTNDTTGPHNIRWRLAVGLHLAAKYIVSECIVRISSVRNKLQSVCTLELVVCLNGVLLFYTLGSLLQALLSGRSRGGSMEHS